MKSIACSNLKNKLTTTIDEVCEEHAPVIITRKNTPSTVLLSPADYAALEETAYLLKSPDNAMRLMESVAELESGRGVEKTLVE